MGAENDPQSMRPVLGYPLDEFRGALEGEIEAASRNAAAGAVSLLNGKRIGKVGASYQYVFQVESPLNLPSDSPGELHVEGVEAVSATIISTEGLAVTLSVPVDLGSAVPHARLRTDLAFLLRRLIDRLEGYAERENPGGDRLLGMTPPSGRPKRVTLDGLNERQNVAIASVLGRDATFVWGPPGTGKTATIGRLATELYGRDRSLLLVSHTNVAVDQALLRIGDQLLSEGRADELEEGRILRVGEPRDPQLTTRPELLLSEHAERRSAELAAEQQRLRDERRELADQVLEDQRQLDLAEWVEHAARDLVGHREAVADLDELQARLDLATNGLRDAQTRSADLDAHEGPARALETQLQELGEVVTALRDEAGKQAARLSDHVGGLRLRADEASNALERAETQVREEEQLLEETRAHGALVRAWKGLPKPGDQQLLVERARGDRNNAADAAKAARDQLREVRIELDGLEAQQEALELLGSPDQWDQRRPLPAFQPPNRPLSVDVLAKRMAEYDDKLATFRAEVGRPPVELLAELDRARLQQAEERDVRDRLKAEQERRSAELASTLDAQLSVLTKAGLSDASAPADLHGKVARLAQLHRQSTSELKGLDLVLRSRIESTNHRIAEIDVRLDELEEALARVEADLVAQATIVATTLTRAYLRDYIQDRRFDTVVLDEASMAPIPALWAAAGVADRAVVAVGDPEQLPPIVQSRVPVAQRWLGRDVFDVAGLSRGGRQEHLVQLTVQYRMHPNISAIPNALVYDHRLVDGSDADDESELDAFYDRHWGPDHPVLSIDTGPLDAWVTTVDRGGSTSRLNFLSATVCADLAEQLLAENRSPQLPGAPPRVIIVTPYRPQANLLALLVREQGLDDEVHVGTAHSFQGSEAPVVVFDLVVDEPHWRVGLFTPDYDESNRRLLNVAVTRARKRLFIVGDLDYVTTKGKRAFLGRLIQYLDRHPRVPAHQVLPAGLAARTAATHLRATGGDVEPTHDRLIVDAADYYRYLAADLAGAEHRVVIYSPFMTPDRVGQLDPHLRALRDRDIATYVITKPLGERPARHRETTRQIEAHLSALGLTVLHKRNMHEKVVIIDDDVCWVGSLNTLSFTDTGEVMERRASRTVARDYIRHLRVNELTNALMAEEDTCPVCETPLQAAEGKRGPYWRCPEECFSRSLDQPYPRDGRLACSSCAADVEFGYWGDEPHWRCTSNRRHRQRLRRQHLRLPAMAALVPEDERDHLAQRFSVEL